MTLTTPPQGLAEAIVEGIFADLRDRRFLKWLFGRPGSAEMVTRDVERLTDDTQEEIAEAWRNIVIAHVSPLLEERDRELAACRGREEGKQLVINQLEAAASERDARIKALEEGLLAVRADLHNENGLNGESIACTIWHDDISTTVDLIDALLNPSTVEGKEGQ